MVQHYLIWVPRSAFKRDPGLYTCFYTFEVLMICLQLIAEPFIMYRMYKTRPLHRNIRLIIVCCLCFTGLSSSSRLVILFFQYTGIPPPETVSGSIVLLASLGREIGLGVVVAIPFQVAAERMVATRHWSWYERESVDTLLIFALILFFSVSISLLNGFCFIYGIYHELGNLLTFAIVVVLGVAALGYVYHCNIVRMRKLSLGARVDGYSVAHTYQIRENITVIKFLFKLVIPAILFSCPTYVAFSTYLLLPDNADYYRHIAVALFDIFVEGFYVSVSAFMWHFVPKLRPNSQNSRILPLNAAQEGNQYFDWLTRDLNKMIEKQESRRTV